MTNYHIIKMIFQRGATMSFSTSSAVHLLPAPVLGSEWATQAKGAEKAEAKEQEVVEL